MTPAVLLESLQRWRVAGWLRPLDVAFAAFMHELDAQAPASLLLAAALLTHLEGRGHSCLPVPAIAVDPAAVLGWPAAAEEALAAALAAWPADAAAAQAAWSASDILQVDPTDDTGSAPLVLWAGRLYLRRYWHYESRVARQVRARTRVNSQAVAGEGGLDQPDGFDRLDVPGVQQARWLLGQLFGPPVSPSTPEAWAAEIDWQQAACALALRGRLTLITGGPGTGKTYVAARLLVLLQGLHASAPAGARPLRIAMAAPTGKAAARLRQSIDAALQGLQAQLGTKLPLMDWAAQLGPARTLHALLGTRPGTRRFVHDASNPLDVDLLFVDEASMVHLEMMAALLDALPPKARVILLGDKDQLASVEAGAVMGDLCQGSAGVGASASYRPQTAEWVRQLTGQSMSGTEVGSGTDLMQQTVVLRRSRRFAGPIGQLALAVNRGDAPGALAVLRAPAGPRASAELVFIDGRDAGVVAPLAAGGRVGADGGYRTYLALLGQRPAAADAFDGWAQNVLKQFDGVRVLCAVRDGPWGVAGLNAAIERALTAAGLLQRSGEWYEGRPVMVTRNDPALGVFNGDIGIVLRAPGREGALRAYFGEGSGLRSVSVGRLADVETAFAMTVHKSQGSEFDHVVLVLPDEDTTVLTRELVYTGITRARSAFTLVSKGEGRLVSAIQCRTLRISGLAAMLA